MKNAAVISFISCVYTLHLKPWQANKACYRWCHTYSTQPLWGDLWTMEYDSTDDLSD